MNIYDIKMIEKKYDFKIGNNLFEIKSFNLKAEKEILISLKKIEKNNRTKEETKKIKASNFKVIIHRRMQKLIDLLNGLSKLSNKSHYKVDHDILRDCENRLYEEIRKVFSKFRSYEKEKKIKSEVKNKALRRQFEELRSLIDEQESKINNEKIWKDEDSFLKNPDVGGQIPLSQPI